MKTSKVTITLRSAQGEPPENDRIVVLQDIEQESAVACTARYRSGEWRGVATGHVLLLTDKAVWYESPLAFVQPPKSALAESAARESALASNEARQVQVYHVQIFDNSGPCATGDPAVVYASLITLSRHKAEAFLLQHLVQLSHGKLSYLTDLEDVVQFLERQPCIDDFEIAYWVETAEDYGDTGQ